MHPITHTYLCAHACAFVATSPVLLSQLQLLRPLNCGIVHLLSGTPTMAHRNPSLKRTRATDEADMMRGKLRVSTAISGPLSVRF